AEVLAQDQEANEAQEGERCRAAENQANAEGGCHNPPRAQPCPQFRQDRRGNDPTRTTEDAAGGCREAPARGGQQHQGNDPSQYEYDRRGWCAETHDRASPIARLRRFQAVTASRPRPAANTAGVQGTGGKPSASASTSAPKNAPRRTFLIGPS